jgi:ABC-type branched-subunit amino acid transport system ATPase component
LQGVRVSKHFGGLTAVNNVDFKIRYGEIVGLLGPNGSGKTTLFDCISGVQHAESGEILLKGKRIGGMKPYQVSRQGLARTFQVLRVYENMTVYENLLLARQWRGVSFLQMLGNAPPPVHEKADELIEFLLLDRVQHNLAGNISLGQQRLLEIGMALMPEPDIVLLDEATSGVNPALIDDIISAIQRLNKEKSVTFFLIEHNMDVAMTLCSRLYVLDHGELLAHGTPEDIQKNEQVIEAYFGRDTTIQDQADAIQ